MIALVWAASAAFALVLAIPVLLLLIPAILLMLPAIALTALPALVLTGRRRVIMRGNARRAKQYAAELNARRPRSTRFDDFACVRRFRRPPPDRTGG